MPLESSVSSSHVPCPVFISSSSTVTAPGTTRFAPCLTAPTGVACRSPLPAPCGWVTSASHSTLRVIRLCTARTTCPGAEPKSGEGRKGLPEPHRSSLRSRKRARRSCVARSVPLAIARLTVASGDCMNLRRGTWTVAAAHRGPSSALKGRGIPSERMMGTQPAMIASKRRREVRLSPRGTRQNCALRISRAYCAGSRSACTAPRTWCCRRRLTPDLTGRNLTSAPGTCSPTW
mmetsp:Transcript_29667/g.79655  ORF Transcript_29667/g.79655 Transcript_29667/m.79655 type:complete len:233 (-) Transcript_29667:111-809(-)